MHSGTFHSSNNIVPDFFKSSTRPGTTQSEYNARFDNSAGIRKSKSFYENRRTSNLGPGSYDSQSGFRTLKSAGGISKTYFPPERQCYAPPVGIYHLPRIMSPGALGSETGVEVTSAFKCQGKGLLMRDGEHYNTLREDKKLSNLGPGYYDMRDNWSPTSFVKHNKDRSKIKSEPGHQFMLTLNKSHNSITQKDKPWQQKRKTKK